MKKFGFNTISNFDRHISDSIAGYDLLDDLIMNICSFYAKRNETIVDLGCTSGRLITRLASKYRDNDCLGYDITDHNFISDTYAQLLKLDITDSNFRVPPANIILSVFTLQFLSVWDRLALLRKIYESLNKNGVFIVCEKEICEDGIYQEVFTFANYDYKKRRFSSDEILQKEVDLRNIMNSLRGGENEMTFKEVGFTKVVSFFQSLNFKGWLCMK